MAAIGCFDEFQVGKEDFDCYMDRMEQHFIANSIAEGKQVGIFFMAISGPMYELVRKLLSPAAPKDKTLAELKNTLQAHLKPKPLMIVERFKFYRRTQ